MTDRNNIRTWSGVFFSPFDPRPENILPQDIAHALSLLCCDEACARGLSREVRLACLLHDASEAFISDITRPVKHNLPEYLVIEKRLQDTIYRRFGIDPEDAEVMRNVSAIDDAMLYHEFLALSGYPLYDSVPEIASQPVFGFRPFEETEKSYLEILYKLTEDK